MPSLLCPPPRTETVRLGIPVKQTGAGGARDSLRNSPAKRNARAALMRRITQFAQLLDRPNKTVLGEKMVQFVVEHVPWRYRGGLVVAPPTSPSFPAVVAPKPSSFSPCRCDAGRVFLEREGSTGC